MHCMGILWYEYLHFVTRQIINIWVTPMWSIATNGVEEKAIAKVGIKIPLFWPTDPKVWFSQVEVHFTHRNYPTWNQIITHCSLHLTWICHWDSGHDSQALCRLTVWYLERVAHKKNWCIWGMETIPGKDTCIRKARSGSPVHLLTMDLLS